MREEEEEREMKRSGSDRSQKYEWNNLSLKRTSSELFRCILKSGIPSNDPSNSWLGDHIHEVGVHGHIS